MTSNKSIDGLITRDAKKPTARSSKPVMPKTINPAAVTGIVKPAKRPVKKPITKTPAKSASSQATSTPPAKPIKIKGASDELDILTESDLTPTNDSNNDTGALTIKPSQSVDDFLSPVKAFDLSEGGELTISETPIEDMKKPANKPTKNTKASKSKKPKQKPSKARRIITTITLVLVLGIIGLVLWAVLWGNDIIAKITGGQGNVFDLFGLASETYDPLKTDENGRTNILAFGTSGYNMDGDEGDGKHDGAQLTDSIMVISLNQSTGDIAMLSLPRDLKASPTCTATGKINEVYWCSNMSGDDEEAGATALMTEVGSILGIEFQYYAHLNWGSLVSIVDTLGGIKVTLDEDIKDYYYTEAVFEAGVEYEIDGAQALGLARARHGTASGDFSRGASQQKILIGIKNKVFEKNLSLADILNLASTLGDNLRTNFSLSELKTLAHLTYDFDFDNMRQISLLDPANNIRLMTTGTINGISYVLPSAGVGNYGAIQSYVKEQLSNDPRIREDATILVLNASETVGLAGTEQQKLETEGYKNITADNAPAAEYPAGTTLYVIGNKPGTKALLEEYYHQTAKEVSALPEVIPLNYDFVIILNPATETE
ncbi:LCP family protein [Candidatus Saccharibacteria bacterium]|nr:LCP family protein [Candidatus Saccharibacteria bacterium]